jgi:hypothetical protein
MCQPATGFANQCAVPLQDWIGDKDSKKIKKCDFNGDKI